MRRPAPSGLRPQTPSGGPPPGPQRGRCAWTPPRALPLEPFILVYRGRGPTQALRGHGRPSPGINQWTDYKGPRPLLEVQEAPPPGGFKGKALALRRFRHAADDAIGVPTVWHAACVPQPCPAQRNSVHAPMETGSTGDCCFAAVPDRNRRAILRADRGCPAPMFVLRRRVLQCAGEANARLLLGQHGRAAYCPGYRTF